MLLKNNKQSGTGNMVSQFKQFQNQINSSGKNPRDILNELVSSGKVSKEQLENATRLANMYRFLAK